MLMDTSLTPILCKCQAKHNATAYMYSRRLASGTHQPSGTPLKNTFTLVRNSWNCSSIYIWIYTTELRSNMTHVTSISKVIRVVPCRLTLPFTCRGLYTLHTACRNMNFYHPIYLLGTLYIWYNSTYLQMPRSRRRRRSSSRDSSDTHHNKRRKVTKEIYRELDHRHSRR